MVGNKRDQFGETGLTGCYNAILLLEENDKVAAARNYMTPEDYLKFERLSEIKHEYYNGEIVAMSGASKNHNRITTSVSNSLYNQVKAGPCEVYSSDMRVRVGHGGLYAYPDIVVVCDTPQFEDDEVDTLLNPTVIVEVLSPSTEYYDRGDKFQRYRTLQSLQEYVLVSQKDVRIEHFIRQNNRWILEDATSLDTVVTLPSINCTLTLSEVYEKVTFEGE